LERKEKGEEGAVEKRGVKVEEVGVRGRRGRGEERKRYGGGMMRWMDGETAGRVQ